MQLRTILERLARGEIGLEEAEKLIRSWEVRRLGETLKLDLGREVRMGLPEVILAQWKGEEDLRKAISGALEARGRALVSRISEGQIPIIEEFEREYHVRRSPNARVYVIRRRDLPSSQPKGKVGIIAAGTSDVPIAEEVRLMVEEGGCSTVRAYDAGVANLKRTLDAVADVVEEGADVIVAIAGMEGSLPSVVASLVDTLVIGLPTSVGYGMGGGGEAALLSMLQSCAPGLVVVNIDNSVAAAYAAISVCRR
ncbi:MAG: nickel pincer cofactor biosynthesis protein LarB [Candidatus Korarchaeota archaeon]|nr:nickel pincer cofactor biosynthesis protein LarB [Candidatus Korarchaeota archaeon]